VELTARQADVILVIRNYRHLHGHAPTFREIADTLGISRATTVSHVKALLRKELIRHVPHRARTLEVLADVDQTPAA
jgi:SOS-response transcriptional repressor LexA